MDGFDPRPVTLEGAVVRLEPLAPSHAEDLLAAGSDPEVWRWLPRPAFTDVADVLQWIEAALAAPDQAPFAIVDKASGRAIGSTRYMEIRPADHALEVGWTWLASSHQRTRANSECKRLLLGHAFDVWGAQRVQLKTDLRNERSQRAIERLGAVREGVLRRQFRLWDGHRRDSVYYSVIDEEWPAVRERLDAGLAS